MKNLFSFEDYKDFIRHQIAENSKLRGYQGRLAEGAGCQRSFLSQVLNGSVHLTPDHAAGMVVFWQLDDYATEYFIELVHYSRAATPRLKQISLKRLRGLRKKQENLSERLRQPALDPGKDALLYYSNWYWAALHLLCGVKAFQTFPEIARRLDLPAPLIQKCLHELSEMGLIEKKGDRWLITQRSLHNPTDSPNTWRHHMNWRQRALADATQPEENSVHYSGLHTLSVHDYARLKKNVHQWIDESRKLIQPSSPEELICLNIDLFVV